MESGSAMPPRQLAELRVCIDAIDGKIVTLLNERARLVQEVGRRKALDGTPVYAPSREQAVLARVLSLNEGPLLPVTLEAIYRELMSGSFALERQLRIGYLGPPGSFSQMAAVKQFGSSVMYENLRTIGGVFEEVARGHVDYGLVPIENSIIGGVGESTDALLKCCSDVTVCAEVLLSVAHAFITAPGAGPSDIKTIHSKPEALAQCQRWLATQYPQAQLVPALSTSAAVETVSALVSAGSAEARSHAAIGSGLAATLHDLPVMFADICDLRPNVTRFLVLCHRGTAAADPPPTGEDKTCLFFVCRDHPGALRDALDAFAQRGINLTQIEKRVCPPDLLMRLSSVAASAVTGAGGASEPIAPAARRPSSGHPPPHAAPAPGGGGRTTPSQLQPAAAATIAPALVVPSVTGGRGAAATQLQYVFLVEFDGHRLAADVAGAVSDAALHCVCLHVIGSFPRARRVL